MKTKVIIVTMLIIFCPFSACFANPITPFPSFGGTFTINMYYALVIDCLADFIALLLAYLVIRNVQAAVKVKFLPYWALVVLGGIIIDAVSPVPTIVISFLFLPPQGLDLLIGFISAGAILYFYNGFLSKKFFKLEDNQARVIGTVMGILTNPVVGWLFLDAVQRWR
jgi:hypothetical protein